MNVGPPGHRAGAPPWTYVEPTRGGSLGLGLYQPQPLIQGSVLSVLHFPPEDLLPL